MAEQETTRREVIQRAVYVAPAILTLVAIPTFASAGSGAESRHRGEQTTGSYGTAARAPTLVCRLSLYIGPRQMNEPPDHPKRRVDVNVRMCRW